MATVAIALRIAEKDRLAWGELILKAGFHRKILETQRSVDDGYGRSVAAERVGLVVPALSNAVHGIELVGEVVDEMAK